MSDVEKTVIPTDKHSHGFSEFIKTFDNKRLFFSAPFGMGKTYFLKEFFSARKADYNVFHLYPVRYQTRNDIEIVEVVGADLFTHLTEHFHDDVKKVLDSKGEKFELRLAVPLLSKGIGCLVGVSPNVIERVWNMLKGVAENQCEKEIHDARARMYDNLFEGLVSEVLESIKRGNKKENVLVLDDLDRLDPRHMFKILNAFSPLYDDEGNKFGFDRVIFVGDIDNVKKVFHHIYGRDTNFEGYIDKFYSTVPYRYDITKEVQSIFRGIVSGYIHSEGNPVRELVKQDGSVMFSVLSSVLVPAVEDKEVNLRNIFMLQNISFSDINNTPKLGGRELRNNQVNISAKIVLYVFGGDKEKLLIYIDKLKDGDVGKVLSSLSERAVFGPLKMAAKSMVEETHYAEMTRTEYDFSTGDSKRDLLEGSLDRLENDFRNEEGRAYDACKRFFGILYDYIYTETYDKPVPPTHI